MVCIWGAMLNLIKLCVGTETVEDLALWQAQRRSEGGAATAVHVTRMWPKRADELLDGGSLYWVIKGVVRARQRIIGLTPHDRDCVRRCAIQLDCEIVRTAPQSRRPFQGWRYLRASEAPRDLDDSEPDRTPLPAALMAGLDAVGVL
jgi:hypothetical protein